MTSGLIATKSVCWWGGGWREVMVHYKQYPCGETKGVCWWGGGCGGDGSL